MHMVTAGVRDNCNNARGNHDCDPEYGMRGGCVDVYARKVEYF